MGSWQENQDQVEQEVACEEVREGQNKPGQRIESA